VQRGLVVARAAQGQELGEPREAADQVLRMGHERETQEVDLLGFVEPVRRGQAETQLRFAGFAAHVRFELIEQRGHEVERDPHLRGLREDRHHSPVILQGVQAHPGQHEGAVQGVAVRRLMHVPEDGHPHGVVHRPPTPSLPT
jgi:hypothetical protein